jgi:hypothetical protein
MEDPDPEWERLAVKEVVRAELRERGRVYGIRMRNVASVTGMNWSRSRRAKEKDEYRRRQAERGRIDPLGLDYEIEFEPSTKWWKREQIRRSRPERETKRPSAPERRRGECYHLRPTGMVTDGYDADWEMRRQRPDEMCRMESYTIRKSETQRCHGAIIAMIAGLWRECVELPPRWKTV